MPNDQKLAGKYLQTCSPKLPSKTSYWLSAQPVSQPENTGICLSSGRGVWRQDCEQFVKFWRGGLFIRDAFLKVMTLTMVKKVKKHTIAMVSFEYFVLKTRIKPASPLGTRLALQLMIVKRGLDFILYKYIKNGWAVMPFLDTTLPVSRFGQVAHILPFLEIICRLSSLPLQK